MKQKRHKTFANGTVYSLETVDGYPVETTDTFLPWYTQDAATMRTNRLQSLALGSRTERWMIGVSVMSGCPVHCKFCATGRLKRWRNLTAPEIVEQVEFITGMNPEQNPFQCSEFKINYTRMGEPFLNIDNVVQAIYAIEDRWPGTHHYVSTIGIEGSSFVWIGGNITLQLSLHSLDEQRRCELIPFSRLMTIEQLGRIRVQSKRKITVNLTLVDLADFDIDKLRRLFDPKFFFIKLSPVNPNSVASANGIDRGVIHADNLV